MNIYIGSDHGGFELKQELLKSLPSLDTSSQFNDLGCYSNESVNYPDLAEKVCLSLISDYKKLQNVKASEDAYAYGSLGILFCGSGQGMAMKANKYPEIRAALCWNLEIAKLAREHNNANILCLPGRYMNSSTALEVVKIFLTTPFAKGRHALRVEKI
jgi:ribose 5-phosphate isomerase B